MQHIDPELLALMALGEPDLPRNASRHLEECERCQSELAALSRVTRLVRASNPFERELNSPPAVVWDRIELELASLAADETDESTPDASAFAPAPAPAPDVDATPAVKHQPSKRRIRRPRGSAGHTRRRWLLPVACILALVIGVGGTTLVLHPWSTTATIQQEASLKPLPAWTGASGTAWLESSEGKRELVVDLSAPGAAGYREVWLMSTDLKRGISVGLLTGDSGSFALPSDMKLADYPVVDISQEPNDGNPAHSGDSIVRGTF